jgi:hypothetical protein
MEVGEDLRSLGNEVQVMLQAAAADQSINNYDLRRFLRFLSKVVEVVEQAGRDIYVSLIEFKYLDENGVSPGRLLESRKPLELLHMRDRCRDAEQICTRLHFLNEQFRSEIEPNLAYSSGPIFQQRSELFFLLDEHEGRIMSLARRATWKLERMLDGNLDAGSIRGVNLAAARETGVMRQALAELQSLQNRILGLPDLPGLLELLGAEPDQQERDVLLQEMKMGDTYRADRSQVRAVGDNARTEHFSVQQVQGQEGRTIDLAELRAALADLHTLLGDLPYLRIG